MEINGLLFVIIKSIQSCVSKFNSNVCLETVLDKSHTFLKTVFIGPIYFCSNSPGVCSEVCAFIPSGKDIIGEKNMAALPFFMSTPEQKHLPNNGCNIFP